MSHTSVSFLDTDWLGSVGTRLDLLIGHSHGADSTQCSDTSGCTHVVESIESIEPLGEGIGLASAMVVVAARLGPCDSLLHVVVKCADVAALAELTGDGMFAQREAKFYMNIAPALRKHLNVRTPLCGGASISSEGARIVMERVSSEWHLGSQIKGLSVRETIAVIRELARMHSFSAQHCAEGNAALKRTIDENTWLPQLGDILQGYAKLLRSWFKKVTMKKIQTVLPGCDAEAGMALLQAVAQEGVFERAIEVFAADSKFITLLHMDVRGFNMFLRDDDTTGAVEVMLFDWQNVCIGHAAVDLTYFLTGSLDIETRRAHERAILEAYVSEWNQCTPTNTITLEELYHKYRLGVLNPLTWAVATASGIDELVDGAARSEGGQDAAREFMMSSGARYLQGAIDFNLQEIL